MLEFIQNNQTLSECLIAVSLLLNALIALKPVLAYIVKRTKSTKDDMLFDKVFSLIDKMSEETKQKLLERIKQ